ncbi:MAG TPA: alpha/beta fold hydrolase [Candidatus Nanoarchaeia archaeon]|nr:alpha/beta fold hydrolase [Candidatus Nanoarchaeia archaeon]
MPRYEFGPFQLDVEERLFTCDRQEIRLRGKVFDTLSFLLANPGRLIRKDELLRAVWPDTIVEENNLDHCISQLRKVFGAENRFIETVPRQGYRFTGEVRMIATGPTLVRVAPTPQEPDLIEQEIRFFTTKDGVRLAYTMGGTGPVLVRSIDWVNHLEFEWKNPFLRRWFSEIMRHNTFVRYDQRGSGLSDWNVEDFSFERAVRDFEELIDFLALENFAIFGSCQGGAVAMAYAARHPERVNRLILAGAFASGWPHSGDIVEEQFDALLTLIRLGWGRDNPAFRQLWTTLFMPDSSPLEMDWMNELQRITTSPENAVRLMSEFPKINVVDLLPKITCPTLVVHSREGAAVSVKEARLIASRIRRARMLELPSRNHQVKPGESAWTVFADEFRKFMQWENSALNSVAASSGATTNSD